MKLEFNFIIDKEANFIYWAQLLLGKWSWYFEKDNSKIFSEEVGILSKEEQEGLEKLRLILEKKNNQYRWLWQRYRHDQFDDINENDDYLFIENVLKKKFELLWQKEYPLLAQQKEELQQYDYNKLAPVLENIAVFLGADENVINSTISTDVKLLISGNFPTGAIKNEFGDLIILNVSRVPKEKISRIVGVLIHEATHLIEKRSQIITDILNEIDINIEVKDGYSYKYLVSETILKSIVSHRANTYMGKFLDFSAEEKIVDEDLSYKLPLREYGYGFLIRLAANRLLPETTSYIEAGKKLDRPYINKVINILNDLLQEYEQGKSE